MSYNFYSLDAFLSERYAAAPKGSDLMAATSQAFPEVAAAKRARLGELLGLEKLRALGPAGETRFLWVQEHAGYKAWAYDLDLLPGLAVPFYLLFPDKPNGKTLLYLNGHGPSVATLIPNKDGETPDSLPVQFAKAGYAVILPELIGFGPSIFDAHQTPEERGCTAIAKHLLLHGTTLAGLRVLECERLLDLAGQVAPHIPMEKIASYGMSGGAMLNSYLFALEPRLDAAIIANYPNTFEKSILAMHHCLCNYVPGILEVGDMAQIIAMGAPKPLLISAGTHDPIFPLEGTEACWADLEKVYTKLGARDKCELELFEGGHEISNARVFPFLEKQF